MHLKASEKRTLGRTGLTVTALGLGTAPLGGLYAPVSRSDADALLEAGWNSGIRYYDSAPMYGYGRSEHILGDMLREKSERAVVSTKVGRLMANERAGRTLPPALPKTRSIPAGTMASIFVRSLITAMMASCGASMTASSVSAFLKSICSMSTILAV